MSVYTDIDQRGTLADLEAAMDPTVDAFGRHRISMAETLWATQMQYDTDPLRMEAWATGTGVAPAHNSQTRMVLLSCTAGTGTSGLQSYDFIPYQAGKSQHESLTGVFDTPVAGAVVTVGYGNELNGIFLRQNGTDGYQIVRRYTLDGTTREEAVNQSDWVPDPVNGTKNRLAIDFTKCFIFVMDLQFLGMGIVRCGFSYAGGVYYVHAFKNAGLLTTPYMQTASLPVHASISATSTAATSRFHFKCAAVESEGGFDPARAGFSWVTPEGTVTAASGARTAILHLRPLTTFNNIVNRSKLILEGVKVCVTGNSPVFWELALGCTFTQGNDPTWASVNSTYSAFQYGTGGVLATVPLVIASDYCPASNTTKAAVRKVLSSDFPITLDKAGAVRAMGTYTLIVTGIGGTSATRASFDFCEAR